MVQIDLTQHIESHPDIRSGKPHIAGSRITVADVALMYRRMGQSLEEIAGKYHLSLASVHAAMAFYYDHQAEIDQRTAESAAFAAAASLKQPSLLQAKLADMKNHA